jgi:long-chain acyl-CoA synthetase
LSKQTLVNIILNRITLNTELAGLEKAALLESPVLKKAVLAQLEEKAKEYKLSGIERVRKVHITPHAFTVQNDTVTPTFKLKRFNAKRFFLEHIQEMYSEGI